MSDNIHKRTIFYARVKGKIRFMDWAMVITPLGTMVEQFNPNLHFPTNGPISNFDPDDECARIDEIREVDYGKFNQVLSGDPSGTALHGGVCLPRVGP